MSKDKKLDGALINKIVDFQDDWTIFDCFIGKNPKMRLKPHYFGPQAFTYYSVATLPVGVFNFFMSENNLIYSVIMLLKDYGPKI